MVLCSIRISEERPPPWSTTVIPLSLMLWRVLLRMTMRRPGQTHLDAATFREAVVFQRGHLQC